MNDVNWHQLRGTREDTPLDLLGLSWEKIAVGREEGTSLYQIGENAFALAREVRPQIMGLTTRMERYDGPRLTRFLWAPSPAAARRAVLGEIAEDDGAWLPPPDELLPLHGRYRFGEVLALAESGSYGDRAWSYLWRMSFDEHRVGRIIYLARNSYYFRSIFFDYDDPVYAIEIDVRSLHRLLAV